MFFNSQWQLDVTYTLQNQDVFFLSSFFFFPLGILHTTTCDTKPASL